MSTLGAFKILRVHLLHVPPAGGFFADLSLDATTLPTLGAPLPITIGDATFLGTVTQAGMDDHPTGGAKPRVTVEGGAGWNTLLARAGTYGPTTGGVRLSTVLKDLATLAGEAYDTPAEAFLSDSYRWPASTKREPAAARHVLAALMVAGAIPTWRVDPTTGRTAFIPWPSIGAADASVRVLKRNLSQGRRTVGCDTRIAALMPGSTIEGVTTRRLRLTESASKLACEVYSG